MLVNSKMDYHMDKENIPGKMVTIMKENGKKGKKMVKEK